MFTLLVLFDAYSVTSRIVSNRIYTETMVGNCSRPLCGIHTNNDVCWDELYFQHANDNGSSCNRQHQTFSNHRGYDVAICCTCCLYTIEILSHFTRICIYHIFFHRNSNSNRACNNHLSNGKNAYKLLFYEGDVADSESVQFGMDTASLGEHLNSPSRFYKIDSHVYSMRVVYYGLCLCIGNECFRTRIYGKESKGI